MEIEELKEWMDERLHSNEQLQRQMFASNEKAHETMQQTISCINAKVTSHDRWLWLIKGVGLAGITVLGWMGIKVSVGQ